MPMKDPDDQFEEYLRAFQPVRPRGLPPHRPLPGWSAALALMAACLLVGVLLLWQFREQPPFRRTPAPKVGSYSTLGRLSAAYQQGEKPFQRVLEQANQQLLPGQKQGGLLSHLGKE